MYRDSELKINRIFPKKSEGIQTDYLTRNLQKNKILNIMEYQLYFAIKWWTKSDFSFSLVAWPH